MLPREKRNTGIEFRTGFQRKWNAASLAVNPSQVAASVYKRSRLCCDYSSISVNTFNRVRRRNRPRIYTHQCVWVRFITDQYIILRTWRTYCDLLCLRHGVPRHGIPNRVAPYTKWSCQSYFIAVCDIPAGDVENNVDKVILLPWPARENGLHKR